MKTNVLSLFDGMSCGMVALERAGIPVGTYYASEIDKYATAVSCNNYPDIIRLGDVTKWREWDIDFSSIDLLLAGFPCQAWSIAGKQAGDIDPRGALVHDLIAIWQGIKSKNPNMKFLFENVKMKKEFMKYISDDLFNVQPILINSALVSAQNRNRYYWTNINNVVQPEDKNILLCDILEEGVVDRDKSYCIDANYWKGGNLRNYLEKSRRQIVFKNKSQTLLATIYKENAKSMVTRDKWGLLVGHAIREKSKCVRSSGHKSYDRHEWDSVDNLHVRKLTVLECERLQTLPDNYTAGVSNTQRYKMIGNGWTVDVIAHILRRIHDENKQKKYAHALGLF